MKEMHFRRQHLILVRSNIEMSFEHAFRRYNQESRLLSDINIY